MSKTLEILEADELQKQIASYQSSLDERRSKLEPIDRLKEGHSERVTFLEHAVKLARLLYGIGKSPREVRAVLREGVDAFAPIVGVLDYSVAQRSYSVAKAMAKKFDSKEVNTVTGRIFRPANANLGPGFTVITVKVRNQPKRHETETALTAALMAWDFAGAERMAEAYHLQPTEKGEDPNSFGLLREAILGHREGALAFLANFPRGYDPDFPPKQRELAEGVIREKPEVIRAGLKSVSKRFKTAWTPKTYATPARVARLGTLEQMMPKIRSHLIGHDWLLSDWAVAWMSLAWHRGLKEAFSDPNLFSEWVPWELCCPEGLPR